MLNDVGIIALLLVEASFGQQPGHAQHTIEGRADFMAHVGQEVFAGRSRRFGGELGCFQGRNIGAHPQNAYAAIAHHQLAAHALVPAHLAIGQSEAVF